MRERKYIYSEEAWELQYCSASTTRTHPSLQGWGNRAVVRYIDADKIRTPGLSNSSLSPLKTSDSHTIPSRSWKIVHQSFLNTTAATDITLCHTTSMGSKRPHSDIDGASSRHNAPNKRTKQHFQSHKPATPGNSTQLGVSLHEVKRRARNIERRFAKGDDLPADVKQKLERELVKCKAQIDEISHKKRRHDMISKYHRVRFFGAYPSRLLPSPWIAVANTPRAERKKAERLRKKLKKQADEATDPEEKANIEADLHVADVDYHYTRYFPFLERYESLYTATENSKDDEAEGQPAALRALHSERPPMWKVVEEAMRNGQAALEELQERRPEKSQERPPEKQKSKTVREKPVRPSKPSPVVKPVPTTPKEEEPKKRPEAVPKMEGNRRMRRAKGIFNEKGPAGSDENGESFFDS